MGWKDQNGNPVTDPGTIQQLELADQGNAGPKSQAGMQAAGEEALQSPLLDPIDFIPGVPIARALGRGAVAAGRGLGAFFRTPASRAQQIEQFASEQLGLPQTAQRLARGRQPVQEAFQEAENVPGKFTVGETPPKQSTILDQYGKPTEIPGHAITGSYKDLLDKEQTLAFQARRMADPVKKAALNDQRQTVLDQMANISMAGPNANKIAFKDIAGKAIMARVESGGGNLLGKMDILLQRKPQYLKAFGIDSPQAVEAFRSMVQTIERTPMDPVSQASLVGKWLLKHSTYVALGAGATAGGLYGYHRYGG